jgi:ABC-type ATPase with predicted acetyltransferase domain
LRRRKEYFRIHNIRRTYDRNAGKFTFNIAYETAAKLTPRTVAVAEAFGLGLDQGEKFVVLDNVELKIGPRDIVYITGDSGSGKSVLLRALQKDLGEEAVDIASLQINSKSPLIETVGKSIEEALNLLCKVGLNDAFLFLRTYDQLSDGQKYRYRIAKLMESKKQWWVLDEFASTLDRDTAKIVAFNLQKLARENGKAVLAATTHTDLSEDLHPSVHIHKRFGKEISVEYFSNEPTAECSLVREMEIRPGLLDDWRRLSGFHYRSHRCGATREVFCMRRGYELCGVILYNYPPIACFGRNLVLPKMSVKDLNKNVSIISRIVIHPKYRSISLGSRLIRDTLAKVGTLYVEMVAVMARYNPFAEKAGMERVIFSTPGREALKIADVLEGFGFNSKLLGSERYVMGRLERLSLKKMAILKQAFKENNHPRLQRDIGGDRHRPYGTKEAYVQGINAATLEDMAKLIKVVGMLLQVKAYLFWQRPPLQTENPG